MSDPIRRPLVAIPMMQIEMRNNDGASPHEERAVFDLRVHVSASDRDGIFALINEFADRARDIAPGGIAVRYTQLRPGHALSSFKPTVQPKRAKR